MSLFESIIYQFNSHLDSTSSNIESLIPPIAEAINLFTEVILADKKILCCTSANDLQAGSQFCHYLMNGHELPRPSLPALFLGAHPSTLLAAIDNDNELYAKQIEALGNKNDTLLLIGEGGQQSCLINAISAAREKEMNIVAILSHSQTELISKISHNDVLISIPTEAFHQTILLHYLISVIISSQIEQQLFGSIIS